MASTADDQARLLVSIEATQARFEKQMARIAKAAGDNASGIERQFKRANDNAAKSFDNTGKRATVSLGQARGAAQNLSFQLNDIAQQLASGTSPFTVMIQQGSQVAQIFSASGTLGGAVRTLGGAFAGLLNPVSLASVALIGVAGYAAQYFAGLLSGGEESEEVLKKQADLIQKVADRWGDALPALRAYANELKAAADANDQQAASEAAVRAQYAGLRGVLGQLQVELANVVDIQSQFGGQEALPKIKALQDAFTNLQRKAADNTATVTDLNEVTRQLMEFFRSTGNTQTLTLAASFGALADQLQTATENATKLRAELALQRLAQDIPLGTIPPVLSSGGQFVNEAELQNIRANRTKSQFQIEAEKSAEKSVRAAKQAAGELDRAIASQTSVAVDAVSRYLGQHERKNAGSINAFLRAGGVDLDAATTAWCAAFVNSALAQVGVSGSGSNVATDFLNWGTRVDPSQIQRGDVLVDPNGRSAGQTGGHVGFATGLARFQDGVLQVQMLSGNASNQVQEDWVNASEVVARRATDAVQLHAGALGHITEASKEAAKQQELAFKQAQQAAEQLGQAVGGALRGLVNAFADGKLEARELLGIVIQLASQLLSMPGGPASGGGFLGGLLGSLFHKGGVVGSSAPTRRVHPAAFIGAPRYHGGGVAGFRPGEVPAILQRGEVVLPRGTRMGGGSSIVIHAPINAPGADAAALARVERSVKELGRSVPKMVDQRNDTRQTRRVRA